MNLEMRRELAFHPELDLQMEVAGRNSEKQIEDIHKLIKSGIDLLIVSPNESLPLKFILDSIYQSGMPIILLDRKTESNFYTAFVGGDNFEIGRSAAKYLMDLHYKGVNALELKLGMTMTPALERNIGFRSEFKEAKKHKIVASFQDNEGLEKLEEKFKASIELHPEINCIFAHTDVLAQNASIWLNKYWPQKNMTIVGVDALPGEGNGIDLVEKKVINASMLYPTGGSEAILVAISILNKLPFEKENKLNTIIINNSNARTVQLQFKKMDGLQQTIDQQLGFIDSFKSIFRTQRIFIFLLITSLLLSVILGWSLWRSLKNKQLANTNLIIKNQEVTVKQIEILEMAEELKLATNAKVNFFTNISHELRTPLTLIIGVTEELLQSKNKANVWSALNQIQQNSFRLLRLINQLMDFRKVESNKMELSISSYNIVEFIRSISDSFRPVAIQRKIDFNFMTKSENIEVWFDADKMDKVIFNILSNAFKFTPDGGSVTISILKDEFANCLKINIEDSGIGIPEEEQEKIFEPFYQTKNSQFTGTGLGLSLSKLLTELHRGSLSVQSIKNRGSRFTISLPLGRNHFSDEQLVDQKDFVLSKDAIYDESLTYQLGIEDQREIKPNTEYHVHIIEDNLEIQQFLRRNFENLYNITQSVNGYEGIDKAIEMVPDLIICDLTLPGLDGIEIIKTLKNDIRTSHIPIIILSSRTTVNQQILGSQVGADAYLTKPFNIQLLEATIKSLIHNRIRLKETINRDLIEIKEDMSTNSLDKDFLVKIISYINQHFTNPQFQITDLCKEVNLSRSQLYRKTKSLLGENISDYIQNKRLATAEQLLIHTDKPISEIAYASGFSSSEYFSTVFKHRYNLSPSQYRRGDMQV